MPTPAQLLFAAILDDDHPRVKTLLKNHPGLAADAAITTARLDTEIGHWFYVGDSALHIAAAGYRVEIAKLLLAAGADPNSAKNHRRSTPLHYAADGNSEDLLGDAKRQVATISVLLDSGAEIHAQDKNGATPLHRAVRTRRAAAVEFLLDAGADPATKNKPGSTAFHLAVQNTGRGGSGAETARDAQHEIIRACLNRGVSPKLKDQKGKSVLDWARNESIRKILTSGKG